MRPVLTYPGTNIPLVRGGAPDPPSGAGDSKAAAAAPAGGGTASPPSGGDPPSAKFPADSGAAPPTEDWQKKYADLEARHKQYERFGKPEQIDEFVKQAQTNKAQLDKIYTDFQEGRLTYAQAKAKAENVQAQVDPFEGYDALEPREQAQRLMGVLKREFEDFSKAELAKIQQQVATQSANLSTQMKLAWKLMQTARANPDVSIDDIIAESTAAAGYSPEQIIDLIVDRKSEPKRIQQKIDEAVAKAKADWQREQDNKKVPPTARSIVRLAPKDKPASPAERHDKIFGNFMDRLNRAAGGES